MDIFSNDKHNLIFLFSGWCCRNCSNIFRNKQEVVTSKEEYDYITRSNVQKYFVFNLLLSEISVYLTLFYNHSEAEICFKTKHYNLTFFNAKRKTKTCGIAIQTRSQLCSQEATSSSQMLVTLKEELLWSDC